MMDYMNMKSSVPYEDRRLFTMHQSANITFGMVADVCKYLLAHCLPKNSPIHDPLVTAIFVLYGRPFKQQKIRLSEDIVPPAYRMVHKLLVDMRDKMYAHTDLDDYFSIKDMPMNMLTGYTKSNQTTFGITIFTPDIQKVQDLVILLQSICKQNAMDIWNKHMMKKRLEDGAYVVNLDPKPGHFLIPHVLEGGFGYVTVET